MKIFYNKFNPKLLLFFFFLIFFSLAFYFYLSPQKVLTPVILNSPQILISPTPSSFPSKHLIKTDFVEQAPEKNWDQPWQDACEEAALLTVDFYYQNKKATTSSVRQAILDMIDYETKQGFGHDINLTQMAQVASAYLGYQTKIITNPTLSQIKQFLLEDTPVVIPANGKTLFAENPNFNQGGPYYHNLTILGYNDNSSQFIVHDVGTRRGAYFRYSYSLLMESIHDLPPSFDKKDINTGSKKILVLLK